MLYYPIFSDHGPRRPRQRPRRRRPVLLSPGEIVDRIVAAGHTPAVDRPQSEPRPTFGVVTEVEREGLLYIVSVSRDAEEIGVQERREEAYEVVE